MIPLKAEIVRRRFPAFTVLLILVNFAVFFHELSLPPRGLEAFTLHYGLVPAHFSQALAGYRFSLQGLLMPMFTSMFLHGGWMHILGNMWFLWVFGVVVEDALGPFGFLALYLACGLGAGATQVAFAWGSRIPTIGASGAISAVMGSYLVLFPKSRVLTLIPLIIFWFTWRLPALFMIGYWFLIQFVSGLASLSGTQMGGTAFWAHVGGFLLGAIASTGTRRRVAWYPN